MICPSDSPAFWPSTNNDDSMIPAAEAMRFSSALLTCSMTISSSEIENVTLSTRFLCHSSEASSRFSSNWKRNCWPGRICASDSASLLLVTMRCSNPASRPCSAKIRASDSPLAITCSIHCGSVAATDCSSVILAAGSAGAVVSSLTAGRVSARKGSWMEAVTWLGCPGALSSTLASPKSTDSAANSAIGIGADGAGSGLLVGRTSTEGAPSGGRLRGDETDWVSAGGAVSANAAMSRNLTVPSTPSTAPVATAIFHPPRRLGRLLGVRNL